MLQMLITVVLQAEQENFHTKPRHAARGSDLADHHGQVFPAAEEDAFGVRAEKLQRRTHH